MGNFNTMKRFGIIVLLAVVMGFASCDYIDQPIPQGSGGPVDTTLVYDTVLSKSNISYRKAILEEFTGQKCTNCYLGADEAKRLDSIYQDSITVVAVHCTNFAKPAPPDYPADFTTVEGNAYETTFGISALPRGMVNRINNHALVAPPSWEGNLHTVIRDIPIVKLDLINAYAATEKQLVTTVNTEWLNTGTANGYKVVVLIVEDSIISQQLVQSTIVQNYVHRHMLRGSLTGEWGTNIPTSNVGDTDSQTFSFDFNTVSWDPKNCEIIAYVYDIDTYEILQVTEAYVKSH